MNNLPTSAENPYKFNKETVKSLRKELIKVPGIYHLRCLELNQIYIGQSKNLYDRLLTHLRGKSGCKILNQFIKKYADWDFFILDYGPHLIEFSERIKSEKKYITLYDSHNRGFNRNKGGSIKPTPPNPDRMILHPTLNIPM